jgi:hypothetical protein
MSVLFDLSSSTFVLLLLICTATHVRYFRPSLYTRESPELHKKLLYKCSVLGDRCSAAVAAGCVVMAMHVLFIS